MNRKRQALTNTNDPSKPASDKKKKPQQEPTSARKPSTKSVNAQNKAGDLRPLFKADFASSTNKADIVSSTKSSSGVFAKKRSGGNKALGMMHAGPKMTS